MAIPALEHAVRALRYWETRQEAMAHNLANVSTTGFKGEQVFARLLEGTGPVAGAETDLTGGTLAATGGPLDVALEGDGFFVVRTAAGERYTRNGAFGLSEDGTLVDSRGNPVLGAGGQSLVLPPGTVEIDPLGVIRVDGSRVGALLVERADGRLTREDGLYFVPGDRRAGAASEGFQVHQGHLEDSNVDPVSALVEMIEIQRAYGALQRSVSVVDDIQQTIANDIGRVG